MAPAMERDTLLPPSRRAERELLLDVLAQRDLDAARMSVVRPGFLSLVPETVFPYLFWVLEKRGLLSSLPAEDSATLAQHYRRNALLALRRTADLRRATAVLREAGVPCLVLKGPVLTATVYPNAATRTMTDLDLLVPWPSLEDATAALVAAGYFVPEQFIGAELTPGDSPPLMWRDPGSQSLELHALLDSSPNDAAAVDRVWSRTRVIDVGHGTMVSTLDKAEFFAAVVTHLSRHHRFDGELRSLLDVALLLASDETEFDWTEAWEEWERRGISTWIALTLRVVETLFGTPVPDAARTTPVREEALLLAAQQVWTSRSKRVPPRLLQLLTRKLPSPVHGGLGTAVAPGRVTGVARLARQSARIGRFASAFASGALRPRHVLEEAELLEKREKLFAIVEEESGRGRRVALDEGDDVR